MLIKNAKILSYGIEEGIYDILIEDGKIKEISPKIESNKKIVDVKEMYVTPGLIDAHTHLGLKSDSAGPFHADHNEPNSLISPHLRAIDGINPLDRTFIEAREAGITACASGPGSANLIGGQYACIKTYGKVIDEMLLDPFIGMKTAFGENPKRVYNMTRMGLASALREFIKKTKNYIEYNEEYDERYEAMIPVIKREKPLKIHAHRADDIVTATRIAKEFNLKYTLDHVTCGQDIVEYLETLDCPLLLGPSLGSRGKAELRGKGFDAVVALSMKKDICIITDAPVIPLQYLPICAGLAISKGMEWKKAFEAVTINPAKVMGVEERVGSLEVGKDADIVVWKNLPLVTIQDPHLVFINGNIVKGEI